MKSKLLPCPFCGTVELLRIIVGPKWEGGGRVICDYCDAEGPDADDFAGGWNQRSVTDMHSIATEQAAEIARLRDALEDAEYDLCQWLECGPELTKAGFNMDGTADVIAKARAALEAKS